MFDRVKRLCVKKLMPIKCPYCGSAVIEAVKSWDMPKMGYHVTHYRCKTCGGLFNHYAGKGREFVLRVGPRKKASA
jgi:DNA-directed RNA polymerase subunit RPC12/RpoP